MSAQKDPLARFGPGPLRESEEPRVVPLNSRVGEISAPVGRTDDPRIDEIRRKYADAQDCDADVLRMVLDRVDNALAGLDDRVETHAIAKFRSAMIAAAVGAAAKVAQAHGGPQKISAAIDGAVAQVMSAVTSRANAETDEANVKERQPRKAKSGIVEAAEDMANVPPQIDYSALPPETVVPVHNGNGEIIGYATAAAMVAAGLVGMELTSKEHGGFDLSQLKAVSARFGEWETNQFKDDGDVNPVEYQMRVDERRAKHEQQKREAQEAVAARQSAEPAKSHAGKLQENRELASLLPDDDKVV